MCGNLGHAKQFLLIIHQAQPPLHGRARRTQLPRAPSIVRLGQYLAPTVPCTIGHTPHAAEGQVRVFQEGGSKLSQHPLLPAGPSTAPHTEEVGAPTSQVMASVMAQQFCHLQNGPPLHLLHSQFPQSCSLTQCPLLSGWSNGKRSWRLTPTASGWLPS